MWKQPISHSLRQLSFTGLLLLSSLIVVSPILIVVSPVVSTSVQAAESELNLDSPLTISADEAIIDDKSGKATYLGSVELSQGPLQMKCDSLEIYMTKDGQKPQVERVVATGKPASFQQSLKITQDGIKQSLSANANTIEYDLLKKSITLEGDAKIVKNDTRFEGESIIYKINEEKIIADSKSSSTSKSRRVKIVLPTSR